MHNPQTFYNPSASGGIEVTQPLNMSCLTSLTYRWQKTASGTSITDPTARWPFPVRLPSEEPELVLTDFLQVTYPQSGVEGIFLQAMHEAGLEVSWSTIPTSIETSKDESDLKNPQAYVSKACDFSDNGQLDF